MQGQMLASSEVLGKVQTLTKNHISIYIWLSFLVIEFKKFASEWDQDGNI